MNRAQYYELPRPEILEAVPPRAVRVLDVGCGGGWLGEQLKRRQCAIVWGIEVHREAAERAATRLDRVWNMPVEQALAQIASESLDCIVTADVLEHLVDPWTVLAELRTRLAPGGAIVASLPNVGHWEVIRNLLEGTWRYTEQGLLDRTHLRFFTRRSVRELFWTAGLMVKDLSVIRRPIPGDVPAALLRALRKVGLRTARLPEEAQAFQYLVVAEPPDPARECSLVGIVVVSSNIEEDALECLASLRRLTYEPVEIVLVVTGSLSEAIAAARARFPEVTVLQAHGNASTGANVGIRHALERGAKYVLLLDEHSTAEPALLARLMETAVVSPEAGIWGPRVCYDSRPEAVWATGFNWDSRRKDFAMQGQGESGAPGETVHAVDALTGSAMMVRREVFERVGMLGAEYRSRWRAIDFCTRAVGQGFTCLVVPAALIQLKIEDGVASKGSVLDEYSEIRDHLRWLQRHGRSGQLGALRRKILGEVWAAVSPPPGWAPEPRKLYWLAAGAVRESRKPFVRGRLRALLDDLLGRHDS